MLTDALTYVDLQDAGNAQSQLILMALARLGDWRTGVYIGPQETIAAIAKCDVRTLRRHVKRLVADGFVRVERRQRIDNGYTTNEIALTGYAEWYSALRAGGKVAAPKAAGRYSDPGKPPPDKLSGGGAANDTPPSDKLSGTTGHLPPDPTGQQVSEHISLLDQSIGSTLPLPPRAAPAAPTAREGAGCAKPVDELGASSGRPEQADRRQVARREGDRGGDTGWPRPWRGGEAAFERFAGRNAAAARIIRPLIGTQPPPSGAEPADWIDQLADVVADADGAVIAAVARWWRRERYARAPSIAEFETEFNVHAAAAAAEAAKRSAIAALGVSSSNRDEACFERFRAAFAEHASPAAVEAYLRHAVLIASARADVATLVLPDAGAVRGLDLGFSAVVELAGRAALGVDNAMIEIVDAKTWRRRQPNTATAA